MSVEQTDRTGLRMMVGGLKLRCLFCSINLDSIGGGVESSASNERFWGEISLLEFFLGVRFLTKVLRTSFDVEL